MGFDNEASSSYYGLPDTGPLLSNSPLQQQPLSSQPKTFANVFIAIVGADVLGLPYTFKRTGWVAGSLMLLSIAALTYHCLMLLVYTRRRLESDHGFSKIVSFGDLGFVVSGPINRLAVDVMIVLSQAGFCVSYLIFIANTLAHIFNDVSDWSVGVSIPAAAVGLLLRSIHIEPKTFYVWGMLPFQLGLNSIKTLTPLAPLSIFADMVDIGAMGIVMVDEVSIHLSQKPAFDAFTNLSVIFYGLGIAVYAFEGVGMVLPLSEEIQLFVPISPAFAAAIPTTLPPPPPILRKNELPSSQFFPAATADATTGSGGDPWGRNNSENRHCLSALHLRGFVALIFSIPFI